MPTEKTNALVGSAAGFSLLAAVGIPTYSHQTSVGVSDQNRIMIDEIRSSVTQAQESLNTCLVSLAKYEGQLEALKVRIHANEINVRSLGTLVPRVDAAASKKKSRK